jgi:hypothetical protein
MEIPMSDNQKPLLQGCAPCWVTVQYASTEADPYEEATRLARIRELRVRVSPTATAEEKQRAKAYRKEAEYAAGQRDTHVQELLGKLREKTALLQDMELSRPDDSDNQMSLQNWGNRKRQLREEVAKLGSEYQALTWEPDTEEPYGGLRNPVTHTHGATKDAARRLAATVDLATGIVSFAGLEAEEMQRIFGYHVYGMKATFLLRDGPWKVDLTGFEQRYRKDTESTFEIRADLGQIGDLWEEAAWERWQQMAEELGTATIASQAEASVPARPRVR